jgi:hypothetical protein
VTVDQDQDDDRADQQLLTLQPCGQGQIQPEEANVRSSPSSDDDDSNVIAQLTEGATVNLLCEVPSQVDGWSQVLLGYGSNELLPGWMADSVFDDQ